MGNLIIQQCYVARENKAPSAHREHEKRSSTPLLIFLETSYDSMRHRPIPTQIWTTNLAERQRALRHVSTEKNR